MRKLIHIFNWREFQGLIQQNPHVGYLCALGEFNINVLLYNEDLVTFLNDNDIKHEIFNEGDDVL